MTRRRLLLLAFCHFVAAGLLFSSTYGFANWLAAHRKQVPSIVFGWEHSIPYVPWTIVPYWSVDLLYALSFFLCPSRAELSRHTKRLVAAQLISFACFLAFPLRCSFEKPETSGLFGWMFQALSSFDQPFNQAPSLHVSLIAILWAKYSEHLRGVPLFLLKGWFIIAALSTLTTYQHQFIDIPTGLWVGLFCIAVFSEGQRQNSSSWRIAALYLCGAVAFISVASLGGGLWLLLWPAGALLVVGVAYATGAPRILTSGAALPLLAPYSAAAWLNSRLWPQSSKANEIVPGIWVGRSLGKRERKQLGIASVVHLAPELPSNERHALSVSAPMLDLAPPTTESLDSAVDAIRSFHAARPTLICCALGYSRSGMAAAAWMVASGAACSAEEAVALIEGRRRAVLKPKQWASLREWVSKRQSYARCI